MLLRFFCFEMCMVVSWLIMVDGRLMRCFGNMMIMVWKLVLKMRE